MPDSGPDDVTRILRDVTRGDRHAVDLLLPLVYGELHRLSERLLAAERPDHTLQPTALVHEAYLRLVHQEQVDWRGRAHFLSVAATVIRRILVDHARRRGREKRGGGRRRQSLARVEQSAAAVEDYAFLDEALDLLARVAPRAARVVELRYFGGLDTRETAVALAVSSPTVEREWRYARAWLHDTLSKGDGSGSAGRGS